MDSLPIMLGFIIGVGHAFEADHIAAVTTIATQTKKIKEAAYVGITWGLGHSFMLLTVGMLALLFKLSINEQLADLVEVIVGVMLILLGLNIARKLSNLHFHRKDKVFHSHPGKSKHYHKSFLIGGLHGLAGSAALNVLVIASVETITQGFLYILFFGVGSVLAMAAVSGIIGIPSAMIKHIKVYKTMQIVSAMLSISVGFYILLSRGGLT